MMNAQEIITEHLDIWTTAQQPQKSGGRGRGKKKNAQSLYGIKKLRELILDLAVRGKLVEQNPEDEPASVLLEKIAEEKKRLIKEGKIKRQKKLPEITEEDKLFVLPKGWEWCRLGEVTNYGNSLKAEAENVKVTDWVLELEDIEKETSKLLQKRRFVDRKFRSSKNRFCKGDVVYGKLRPYLDKVIVADEDGVCSTEMIPIRGHCNLLPTFLRMVLKSPYFIRYANKSTHGMNLPRMGTVKARLALFPVCSEFEQHRIVAKVDELMTLCDQLEQQQTTSNATHQTLLQTLLATLINSADHQAFTTAWQQIASHFDLLFTTEQSIDQLKQTILQLAVMGKLVPQNPEDEPASVLLEKIAKEKARLIKEGKIKKQKKLPEITEEEKPFDLPNGWEWGKMMKICTLITDGTHQTPQYTDNGRIFISAQNVKPFEFMPDKHRWVSEEDFQGYIKNRKPEQGDVLLTRVGAGIGEAAVIDVDIEFAIYVSVGLLKPSRGNISSKYLVLWLNSPLGRKHSKKNTYGKGVSQGNLNLGLIRNFLVSLPPLAEQHRIVAKVDELMALCDQLKTRLHENQTTKLRLADTIVNLNGDQP